jgi:sodium transport system permease protein
MTFNNVKLIVSREIRDQLRDRRTLFVIIVLPILLYPLLGMSLFQVSQFMTAKPVKILVVGSEYIGELPPLFDPNRMEFSGELFADPANARLLDVDTFSEEPRPDQPKVSDPLQYARNQVLDGKYDAALYFPPDFRTRLMSFRETILAWKNETPENAEGEKKRPALESPSIPGPEIIFTTANEKSRIASKRLYDATQTWTDNIGKSLLADTGVPAAALKPFHVVPADLASASGMKGAAVWATVLPIMLLLWALTGAFYPAIDLCAGEKERGTLETLLSSPAERGEIVLGKLLTIMAFSVLTTVLNLISLALTGWLVLSKITSFGSPTPIAFLWISLALLPVAALFSAVCLALAAFAKSSKEGQYYLMPVLLITMPLVMLPMSPGAQLNLGFSLIPVTGVVLLLKTLLEGHYLLALQYAPVVVGVTVAACWLAVRWAIDQFNSESVLFAGGDPFNLKLWLKHLYRDRKPTPTVATAITGGVSILMLQFFLGVSAKPEESFAGFTKAVLIPQIGIILVPTLLLSLILTSKPRETLRLTLPNISAIPAAILSALALHPSVIVLKQWVVALYPPAPEVEKGYAWLDPILRESNLGLLILLAAVTPAICEEFAVRGFLLSGLRHIGYKWRAIAISSLFFALIHGVLQQEMNAFVIGLILGYIAVQGGSIWPCMLFHFTHNTVMLLYSRITPELCDQWPSLRTILDITKEGDVAYHWQFVVLSFLVAVLTMVGFSQMRYVKTAEEKLREAIRRGQEENPEDPDISISLASMIK